MFTGAWAGFEHVIITGCICFILYILINKNKNAKSQDERLARPLNQLDDWDDYLAKLCRITGKNAGELMRIAAQEAGLSGDDRVITQHFREFIKTGELPQYMVKFLEKGKDEIDKVNDEPVCKSQDLGMF